jgi:peptidoglycan/xylan/chitin deacetylase (PgdA/CDA1 family)
LQLPETDEPVIASETSVEPEAASLATTIEPAAEPTLAPTAEPTPTPEPTQAPLDYAAVKPYEVGQIMIIMYHGISKGPESNPYERSQDNFWKDMETLYDMGFRLASLKDWAENKISVEAGYTPVIFTFDDGLSSTFSLEANGQELRPVQGTAVELMDRFSEQHPDFGNTAAFYINGDMEAFKGAGTIADRLQYLVGKGHDIGNHTYSHAKLSALGAEDIQKEIGLIDKLIKDSVPGYKPLGLSYPFGIRPKEELLPIGLDGTYQGEAYSNGFGLREGQSGPPATPNRNGFDPLNVPRVRGSSGEATDLGWFLDYYKTNPEGRYISDGNPETIAVPLEYKDNINMESLGDKKLVVYDESGILAE